MTALDMKTCRDLRRLAVQLLAVAIVMACGVSMVVMAWSMLRSLELTRAAYYEEARFADVFVHLKRAPDVIGRRLARLPGISRIDTRVVEDVTLDLPAAGGTPTPTIGRFISLPERSALGLHQLHIVRGRWPDPARRSEAVVSEGFALAHGLEPGDSLHAVLNGRRTRLDLVAVATSPEYVYTIRTGDLFPDNRSFGIVWIDRKALAAAFDMEDAFNDVVATLSPGARLEDVCLDLDRELDRYGGLAAFGREFQPSHRYLTNELRELRNMGLVAPVVFLAVTAILLHLVLSRLVGAQREQIATLAAFGYTPLEIGLHFLKLAAAVVAVGAALGVAGGWVLGQQLTAIYAGFFRFPVLRFALDFGVVAWSVACAAVAALLGVGQVVWRAVAVNPAAAMQPEPPLRYRPAVVERLGLGPILPLPARMILRHLERRPVATGLSILGIAMAAAVMVLGMFVGDAVRELGDFQFTRVQQFDRSVTLVEPTAERAIREFARLPGVKAVEPFRVVAASLRAGHRERRQEILGLDDHAELFRMIDRHGRRHAPRRDGLVVSAKLADLLGARVGDTIDVNILEMRRPRARLKITGTIDDMVGTAAYLHIDALRRLLGEGDTISGAFLAVDSARAADLDRRIADTPRVAGFVARDVQLRTFRETIARTLLRMRTVNTFFAAVIACGVVLTTARQSVAERSRDLASLRVLGFTRAEVSAILLGEQAVLTLAAVPLGLFLGLGFVVVTSWGYDTELFRVPVVVHRRTFAIAAATVLAAALASALVVRRSLDRIDLVAVLKAKD